MDLALGPRLRVLEVFEYLRRKYVSTNDCKVGRGCLLRRLFDETVNLVDPFSNPFRNHHAIIVDNFPGHHFHRDHPGIHLL